MSATSGSAGGQGRLAQVLATRGGQAAPEAPFVIEHREALIYMLCEAAELEHGIMCQYLFAAFSLKQRTDEGLTDAELAAVTRWRKVISHVATEEMLHLALVHNLLSAIGAAPHFSRPNLPHPAHHYPAGVQLKLVPFGEPALRHFMFLERPEGMQLRDADGLAAAVEQSEPLMAEADIVPRSQDFATVGHLYRSIEHGIAHLAEKYGEQRLFVGPPTAQATSTDFGWPELVPVTDLASAQRAIDTILEQGEGARGHWQDAHFGQFVKILDEYLKLRDANRSFDPVRPVLSAKVRPGERDQEIPLIGDPITARCTDLFNVGYEVLLQMLERYFAHTEESAAQLGTLADATVAVMVRVLKPLGELITTLPVGPEHPGMAAGPSFELFYETDYLMPHRAAAWFLLEERLHDAVDYCERIEADAGEPLATGLQPVGRALKEIGDSLAARFGEWGAVSRYAQSVPQPGAPDPGGLESLLDTGATLAGAVSAVEFTDPAAQRLADLFARAQQLLEAVATDTAGAALGTTAPPAHEIGGRLVNSVLRPLAGAVAGSPAGTDKPAADPGARPDGRGSMDAGEGLWELAQKATELRASLAAAPEALAGLAEATACLQDLSIQLAPATGPSSAEARLARLRQIQSELAPGIEVSADGPYLVTNAGSVRDWLGAAIAVRPQIALCRCGASAIKPFCDGTHAQIGFSGEKDPKRVPDRRDTYVGQQLTILDNRGICQHSGFCTDRIATAFRADGDPFVAPSGGRMDELIRAERECPSGALSYAIDGVEARDEVDRHGQREPTIEVTRNGPYRITGSLPLTDGHGDDQPRNEGASREHYALCRCGQSQNKPFCSGMHWYVEFRDPVADPDSQPTLFEWCGGLPALTRMTTLFYEKHVPQDPLLAPLFANMSPDHPERVAAWLGEVLGGPSGYSDRYGGYERMVSQHLGRALTEEQRARWVALICQSAQETGLPADPEWRSAFNSYIEWGSRLALENSQQGAKPPMQMPMPRWDWGAAGPPGGRVSALEPDPDEDRPAPALPGPDEPLSYEQHIKPLFRRRDRQSMSFAFDLWSYEDVRRNADGILGRLRDGSMPCDGAWAAEQVDAFGRWVESGTPA